MAGAASESGECKLPRTEKFNIPQPGEEIFEKWFWRCVVIHHQRNKRERHQICRQPEVGESPCQCGRCKNVDHSTFGHHTPTTHGRRAAFNWRVAYEIGRAHV